jgi:HEAT repeat protein
MLDIGCCVSTVEAFDLTKSGWQDFAKTRFLPIIGPPKEPTRGKQAGSLSRVGSTQSLFDLISIALPPRHDDLFAAAVPVFFTLPLPAMSTMITFAANNEFFRKRKRM